MSVRNLGDGDEHTITLGEYRALAGRVDPPAPIRPDPAPAPAPQADDNPDAWKADAGCRYERRPEWAAGLEHHEWTRLWFPERGERFGRLIAICQKCPVSDDCLDYATRAGQFERVGIWGGLSERQRRNSRNGRPVAKANWIEADRRRAEVDRLTGTGLNDKQIAERLGCTPRQVRYARTTTRAA